MRRFDRFHTLNFGSKSFEREAFLVLEFETCLLEGYLENIHFQVKIFEREVKVAPKKNVWKKWVLQRTQDKK